MKSYPSIPQSTGQSFREFQAYVFDKIDGSNLRFEWARKSGWGKFGTRNRLFDESDPVFGEAIPLFFDTLAEPLEKIAHMENWERVTVYAEFWGEKSFAGLHEPGDPKTLTLFDVAPHKKGLLGPEEFLKKFDHLPTPKCLGQVNWTRDFVRRVREGELEGVTFEGVVGKSGEGHKLIMAKAKTQAWVDVVRSRCGDYADHIISS